MELKRILARDTRTATEKAIALYGADVLIVANQRVGGQTELVLALDIEPEAPTPPAVAPSGQFQNQLDVLMRPAAAAAPSPLPAPAAMTPAENDRERLRSQEIVAMVRDELAHMRREFRLSQSMSWQDTAPVSEAVQPLIQALNDAGVPMSLRALLVDGVRGQTDAATARQHMHDHLTHAMTSSAAPAPRQGVHVLAGASGAGKSLMCARLAKQAALDLGTEQVALISFRDMRAGAWSQLQILGAQAGVETFRATDASTLGLLLAELGHRQLILIDTAGVDLGVNLQHIRSVCPSAQWHAVVCADASETSLRRVLIQADFTFSSLMLSKFDESGAPWSLVQFLCNASSAPALSVVSRSDRLSDPLMPITPQELVDHVMNLSGLNAPAPEAVQPFNLIRPSKAWMTGSAHA